MFAIAFDLVVADTERHHPKGVSQAYDNIGASLYGYGFRRVQGSFYVTDNEDMANLFLAIQRCGRNLGSRRQYGISVLFVSSNGRNLPIWRRLANIEYCTAQ